MNCFAVNLEFFGHNCCILSPIPNYLINICLVKSSSLTSYRLTYEENVVITEGTIQLNSWKQREQLFDKYSRFSWRQRMQKRHSLGNKRNICVCWKKKVYSFDINNHIETKTFRKYIEVFLTNVMSEFNMVTISFCSIQSEIFLQVVILLWEIIARNMQTVLRYERC